MPANRPERPTPGVALVLPRVSDPDTQRALDRIALIIWQIQSQLGRLGTTDIDIFTATAPGLVPAAGVGSTLFLRQDHTFALPAGGAPPDADYGDIVVSAGGASWTIDSHVVTPAKMSQAAANTFFGNNTGSTADRVDMTVAQAQSLLALAVIATSGSGADLTAHSVTAAKQTQMPAFTVKGNGTGSTADEDDLTILELLQLLGVTPSDVGDGSDGSPVFDGTNTFAFASKSGNTYTLTRSVFFDLPTIDAGVTLKPDSFPVRCKFTPVINGVVDQSGGDASGTTDGTAASSGSRVLPVALSAGTNSTNAPQVFVASSAANGGATAGGSGTNGAAGTAGTKGRGGGGGAGGNNNPFTEQGASGDNAPTVALATDVNGDIRIHECASSGRNYAGSLYTLGTWGGKGGLGGSGTGGGGRGAAGGYIYWASPGISGSGVIRAKGGAGGNGTSGGAGIGGAGGGGGGAGGLVILALQGFPNSNTTDVVGGAAGSGAAGGSGPAGNGGAGAAGGAGDVIEI